MPRVDATEIDGRHLPILEVEVELGQWSGSVPALLDSGAGRTVVPAEVLENVGIPFDTIGPLQSSRGAGGRVRTRVASGSVRWNGRRVAREFAVAEPGALPLTLLGRDDFFTRFVIRFNWRSRYVDVDPA